MAAELAGREAYLSRYARGSETAAIARLERGGYRVARRWAEMSRPDFAAIPALAPPDGIELTRIDPALASDEAMLRRVFEVGVEVFADHYGEATPTEADWRKFVESPQTQPALWCIATDVTSGEIAGHILNYLGEPEPDGAIVGWTESIAVRAPYRRRGLASAMLAESLRIVRDAGASRAALGVDQQNPNQAMTLYERLGFRVKLEDLEFHRPIELPGTAR
jgi:ribosomal protein S18 acetylase RimI-like enzyme